MPSIYRYPSAQIIVGFAVIFAGTFVALAGVVGLPLLALVWPERLEGNRLLLLPFEAMFIAAVIMSVRGMRWIYARKRPLAIDSKKVAAMALGGGIRVEMPWDQVNKIQRQFLYDSFANRNGYSFKIFAGERVIQFDDSIENFEPLIEMLNAEIATHGIYAYSTERGPQVFAGVTDVTERRELAKNGRSTRVVSF
jgi:hypothetical protein